MRSTIRTGDAATAGPFIRSRSTPNPGWVVAEFLLAVFAPPARATLIPKKVVGFTEKCWRLRHGVIVTLGVLVTCLGLGASGSSAAPNAVTPCFSPSGVDLNERYGVSEVIVAPFCTEVSSGRRWTVSNRWFMSPTFEAVPDGFEPAGETPLEDFVAKFIGVKYVVDSGTSRERTYVFGKVADLAILDDGLDVFVNPLTLGALKPSSVGDHVVDSYLLFNALHCDGLAAVLEENCLPAGETYFSSVQFTVTPGHE